MVTVAGNRNGHQSSNLSISPDANTFVFKYDSSCSPSSYG